MRLNYVIQRLKKNLKLFLHMYMHICRVSDKKGLTGIIQRFFFNFSTETCVVTPHKNCQFLMKGHDVCFFFCFFFKENKENDYFYPFVSGVVISSCLIS